MLYDLFTCPAVVEGATPLLLVCNTASGGGADAAAAHKTPAEARAILESELERLRVSRPAVAQADADEDALLLGAAGEHFRFDRHAPGRVEAVALGRIPVMHPQSGAEAGEGMDAVRQFILEARQ
jgi:hypothetical protein